jgi:spermidine synthase
MNTFTEKQPWGTTSYTIAPGSHLHFETSRGIIDILTNPHFGRMLFIDNVLQSTTSDELMYHRPLVKSAMGFRHNDSVLIVGGAEGATLREVISYDRDMNTNVKEIFMVDWDQALVEHMKQAEPWAKGSFDDSRLHLIHDDIENYFANCTKPFDTIILDLLDPNTLEELAWLKKQIFSATHALNPNGRITVNCGSNYAYVDDIKRFIEKTLRTEAIKIETLHVPSFMEPWYLLTIQTPF